MLLALSITPAVLAVLVWSYYVIVVEPKRLDPWRNQSYGSRVKKWGRAVLDVLFSL